MLGEEVRTLPYVAQGHKRNPQAEFACVGYIPYATVLPRVHRQMSLANSGGSLPQTSAPCETLTFCGGKTCLYWEQHPARFLTSELLTSNSGSTSRTLKRSRSC